MAILSFSPYLPNSPVSPTFMGPTHCLVLCLVGDCGKIVIFAIFAKFASITNFYGPPHCFVLRLVGDCGNIVIFAIFAKFASIANFYGAHSLLCALPCWRLWQNCHFRHICHIRQYRQLLWAPSLLCALPCWRFWQNCHFRHICQIRQYRQLLWGPLITLCFALLAIVAILSFSPYLLNSSVSPTFMGPTHCFVLCLVGDCGKIVIFAIFAKFASIANFYGPPHCFVLCLVGNSGKIVIFAMFAKFAIMFSFLPFLLLRAFLDISRFVTATSYVHPKTTVADEVTSKCGNNKK